jgi:hypothetical protein
MIVGPLVQIVMVIGMTHGVRALGRWVGPRRGGLLMGVPSTTALVLVGCGLERGLDEATLAAESCLAGLVAAAVLPLVYARAAGAGWRSSASAGAAVAGYAAVAAGIWWLPALGTAACVAGAGAGVVMICHLAGRVRAGQRTGPRTERVVISRRWTMAYRTAVPVGSFLTVRLLRAVVGTSNAGRFITFPGASLAVLVTTHLEAGPEAACRTAAAMPVGCLGMLAFLTTFRFGCPRFGLAWGTALGFVAALVALVAVGSALGPKGAAGPAPRLALEAGPQRSSRTIAPLPAGSYRRDPADQRARRPRVVLSGWRRAPPKCCGFSPRFELLSG